MTMLNWTLESEFVPGSNLEEEAVAFADWRYLAPEPAPPSILCLDWPTPHTRAFLKECGAQVYILSERAQSGGPFPVLPLAAESSGSLLALPDGEMALILVETSRAIRRLGRDPGLAEEVERVLAPGGAVYLESSEYLGRAQAAAMHRLARRGLADSAGYWLSPLSGAIRTAAPLRDLEAARLLFRNVLFGRSRINRFVSRVAGCLSQNRFFSRFYPRRGFVVGRHAPVTPPWYLRQAAERNGLEISTHRLVVSARGRYRSNKIIFFLLPRESSQPEWVIKVSRTPEFNHRLKHENAVLAHLADNRLVDTSTLPRVRFFDCEGERAILCQEAVAGALPFQSLSTGRPDCPWARRAVEWLIGLTTGSRSAINMTALNQALPRLYRKFIRIYPLPAPQRRILEEMVERLLAAGTRLFSVLQHGDPGVQNILVRPPSSLVFLDWESGEIKSLPLWDLFYFLRTYVNWAERRRGSRDALTNFQAHFMKRGRFTPLLASAVASYCQRSGVDQNLVEPLFFTCWMHRCLKEAILLRRESVWRGAYIRLLQSLLESPQPLPFCSTGTERRVTMMPALEKALP